MEVEPQASGVPDGWEVVSTPAAAKAPTSDARPSVSARAGVPAAGRGSQINPDQSMRGVELATTPLARPTGIDAIDGLTSPLGIASVAAGGYGIARAGLAGGAAAAGREALATGTGAAAAQAKYWATKGLLIKMGVPSTIAEGLALVASGIKKGGAKGEPVGASSNVPPPIVETAQEALARKVTSGPTAASPAAPAAVVPGAPAPRAAVPPPPAVPGAGSASPESIAGSAPSAPLVPPPPTNTLPDQKALNEAALARRRVEYQASQAAKAETAAPAATKPMLLASEAKEYVKLLQAGKSAKEAMAAIEAARALNQRLGLSTPTAADTRFPKGMRGGLPE